MGMDERPITRYAKTPDGVHLAYQVTGDGPIDLFFVHGLVIPIDLLCEEPSFVRFAKRIGRFSRTVWYEPRGIGASGGDRSETEPDDADMTTILDAAGCERVVLLGTGHSGPPLIYYAAAHPERVTALILIDTYAHYVREDDYPWGIPKERLEQFTDASGEMWGTRATVVVIAPSKSDDEAFCMWYARGERLGLDPDKAAARMRAAFMRDVRSLLPTLTVPTLVLHREGNLYIRVGAGRYLDEHIPGAKYVELLGNDHLFFAGDTDAILDEIEEFLTGAHQDPEGDVATATILFTDIVSSTEQATKMGHRKWTALSDAHDAMVRSALQRHRGREVKTVGDGFLASFDSTSRAVRAAAEIVEAASGMGLEVRAGVHTGEVEVRRDDVVGLSVSIAKRVCDLAGPGEVLVSRPVTDLVVGSGIEFTERGEHELRGVPGTWKLFGVKG